MHWWPNQIASIRSGAWILIPNEHTDTSDVSSKTDQDTDQETWILISNLNYHAINYSLPYFEKLFTKWKLQFWKVPSWSAALNKHIASDTKYCSINSFGWISFYPCSAPIQWQICFANNSDSSIAISSASKPIVNQVISERASRRNGCFSLTE